MREACVSVQVAGRVCSCGSAMSQGCVFLKVRCEPVFALGSGRRAGCVFLQVCCGKVCALGSGMHEGCVFLGNRDSAMVFAFVCEMREGCVLWKCDARRVCAFCGAT